jgi:hypothetical protein
MVELVSANEDNIGFFLPVGAILVVLKNRGGVVVYYARHKVLSQKFVFHFAISYISSIVNSYMENNPEISELWRVAKIK